jgi:PRTRC genetic system protein B
MMPHVEVGDADRVVLSRAVLVYSHRSFLGAADGEFATVHSVIHQEGGRKTLGAGELLSMSFLQELASGLGSQLKPEILPPCVICRTPHIIAWYTPSQVRTHFFYKDSKMRDLSGRDMPVPALVWRLSGHELHVRALRDDTRPTAETKLFMAPFWNTNSQGLVCQGSMRRPSEFSVKTLDGWVDGYFGSHFTHDYGNSKLTTHPKGFEGLWREVARRKAKLFPAEYLTPIKQTLEQFVAGDAQD